MANLNVEIIQNNQVVFKLYIYKKLIYYTLDNVNYTDISQIERYNYFSDFLK